MSGHAAWKRYTAVLAPVGVALLCLISSGDTPVGAVHAADACSNAQPGAGDYCASDECGPCFEGEGDCDPGQCQDGLTCVEEGAVDHCRVADGSCDASPGSGSYCASSECGPCGEGEGDCDPGQCASGLECVEEGSVDRCRIVDDSCDNPGGSDFCASDACGPCFEGEGDCDPGQCADGLTCVEEGSVDRCRPAPPTQSLQVKLDGVWRNVCCDGSRLAVTDGSCGWTELDRRLTDETEGRKLFCPEGGPAGCECNGWGERMHGINGWNVNASLDRSYGGPVYPDYTIETCVYVQGDGELATKWTDSSCPYFRWD